MTQGSPEEIPRRRRRPLYQGVKDSERPLDKGENVCEANEGDLRRSINNMIYIIIMLLTPNVSLTDCLYASSKCQILTDSIESNSTLRYEL